MGPRGPSTTGRNVSLVSFWSTNVWRTNMLCDALFTSSTTNEADLMRTALSSGEEAYTSNSTTCFGALGVSCTRSEVYSTPSCTE